MVTFSSEDVFPIPLSPQKPLLEKEETELAVTTDGAFKGWTFGRSSY